MSTLHLVRPELRPLLEVLPTVSLNVEMLAASRANPPVITWPPIDPLLPVAITDQVVPGFADNPAVHIRIYRPTDLAGQVPGILHIHGGGYIAGSIDMNNADNQSLAAALGCVIVSVDYRLAPDTPFPGPLEDCYAALKWMFDNRRDLGLDAARIAVKGESAGGGLAAALALLARDREEIPIAFQCLIFPMLDDRMPAQPNPHVGEFVWTADSNRFGWQCYLGREPGGEDIDAYAAPARAKDLAGLPPAWIMTGGLDLFLEEDIEYARRLMRAGVPVDLVVYSGAYHGFHLARGSDLVRKFEMDCREALALGLGISDGRRGG